MVPIRIRTTMATRAANPIRMSMATKADRLIRTITATKVDSLIKTIMATKADSLIKANTAGAAPMARENPTKIKAKDMGDLTEKESRINIKTRIKGTVVRTAKENRTGIRTTMMTAEIAVIEKTTTVAATIETTRTEKIMTEAMATGAEKVKGEKISTKRIKGTAAMAAAKVKALSTARRVGIKARKKVGTATYRLEKISKDNSRSRHKP